MVDEDEEEVSTPDFCLSIEPPFFCIDKSAVVCAALSIDSSPPPLLPIIHATSSYDIDSGSMLGTLDSNDDERMREPFKGFTLNSDDTLTSSRSQSPRSPHSSLSPNFSAGSGQDDSRGQGTPSVRNRRGFFGF